VLSLSQFLTEDSDVAGSLDLCRTNLATARKYAAKVFAKYGRDFAHELPDFDVHYSTAQGRAFTGTHQRQNMPVISEKDIKDLQARLEGGTIDIRPPHSAQFSADPFPDGLSGEQAKHWLKYGLPTFDGAPISDDIVKCSEDWVAADKLCPLQKQIYFDKSITSIAKRGDLGCVEHVQAKHLIVSSDRHIVDGHHRWLSIMLIDPTTVVLTLSINLPVATLLPLALAYSDAIGNERNQ
jgi:hypothetical protein